MEIVTSINELRAVRAKLQTPVGFVPTMGALHEGHVSLVSRARAQCAVVVVSVFVNPLQFGPTEDYLAYPRPFGADKRKLEELGVDVVFFPEVAEMYPSPQDVFVEPTTLSAYCEGERRPGHFRGVATVVLKLLNIVTPQHAYFGDKDAQQLAVIKRMAADLNLPIEIVGCPTVRDADGLALSSRSAYLSGPERRAAANLNLALRSLEEQLESGKRDVNAAIAIAARVLPPLRSDYLAVVSPNSFKPLAVAPPSAGLLAVGAAFAGNTRLIDSRKVQTPANQE